MAADALSGVIDRGETRGGVTTWTERLLGKSAATRLVKGEVVFSRRKDPCWKNLPLPSQLTIFIEIPYRQRDRTIARSKVRRCTETRSYTQEYGNIVAANICHRRSNFPSPLKSPTAKQTGPFPTAKLCRSKTTRTIT